MRWNASLLLDQGLSKNERLRRKEEFDNVFKKGKRLKLNHVIVIYAPNGLDYSRMGISIKKSFGKAVKRNRAKRLIRELFRRNKRHIPLGYDLVFIPMEGFLEHYQEIYGSFGEILLSRLARSI